MLLQLHHLNHNVVGQGQSAEQHGAEQQAVFVCGVVRGKVVQVEDTDTEHREVGTHTKVRHNAMGCVRVAGEIGVDTNNTLCTHPLSLTPPPPPNIQLMI